MDLVTKGTIKIFKSLNITKQQVVKRGSSYWVWVHCLLWHSEYLVYQGFCKYSEQKENKGDGRLLCCGSLNGFA